MGPQFLDMFHKMVSSAIEEKSPYENFKMLKESTFTDDFSYFKFIPKFLGSPKIGESLDAPAPCF